MCIKNEVKQRKQISAIEVYHGMCIHKTSHYPCVQVH